MTAETSGQATTTAPAVVVGLCVHGLALVRALHAGGVRVLALEANRTLPGFHTRMAEVRWTPEINGPGLIEGLIALRQTLPHESNPILHVTNDTMVRTLANHWERLHDMFQLNWSECRETVLSLLNKTALEAHCQHYGLPYPKTRLLTDPDKLTALRSERLKFPLIVKPAWPMSGFKVRLIKDFKGLEQIVQQHPEALPFLLQHWVPGDDRRILFTAFYLDEGRILASFEGRKLAAKPPALGFATVAESFPNTEMRALAERFFAPLKLSGPVSLEAKFDAEDRPWIIEPTLGRTDYLIDCCVANGVNLPLVGYQMETGQPVDLIMQRQDVIWFDTERSPGSYLRLRLGGGETATRRWRPRFAYWNRADPMPFWIGLLRFIEHQGRRVLRRIAKLLRK